MGRETEVIYYSLISILESLITFEPFWIFNWLKMFSNVKKIVAS